MGVSKTKNNQEWAILLRRSGMSLSEIASELKVSKGAISKWLKGVHFSAPELQLIAKQVAGNNLQAHNKSRLTKQVKRVFAEREVLIEAQNEFKKFRKDPLFLSGISLYWSQGSFCNDYFQFTSSDTEMLKVIIGWMKTFLHIKPDDAKYRLFLNGAGGDQSKIADFWANSLLIPRGNFMSAVLGKNKPKTVKSALNKGSIQIVVTGINHIRKIKVWQKLIFGLLL